MKRLLKEKLGFYDSFKISDKQEKALEDAYAKPWRAKGQGRQRILQR